MPDFARDLAHPAARRSDFGGRGPGSLGDRTTFKWASGLLRACARARDLYNYAAIQNNYAAIQTELVA